MQELETMKQLKPHPYVIKLLGCVMASGELIMIRSLVVSYPSRSFFTQSYSARRYVPKLIKYVCHVMFL